LLVDVLILSDIDVFRRKGEQTIDVGPSTKGPMVPMFSLSKLKKSLMSARDASPPNGVGGCGGLSTGEVFVEGDVLSVTWEVALLVAVVLTWTLTAPQAGQVVV